jgi:hypothetical protein
MVQLVITIILYLELKYLHSGALLEIEVQIILFGNCFVGEFSGGKVL